MDWKKEINVYSEKNLPLLLTCSFSSWREQSPASQIIAQFSIRLNSSISMCFSIFNEVLFLIFLISLTYFLEEFFGQIFIKFIVSDLFSKQSHCSESYLSGFFTWMMGTRCIGEESMRFCSFLIALVTILCYNFLQSFLLYLTSELLYYNFSQIFSRFCSSDFEMKYFLN